MAGYGETLADTRFEFPISSSAGSSARAAARRPTPAPGGRLERHTSRWLPLRSLGDHLLIVIKR
jgi:hypothetical protein